MKLPRILLLSLIFLALMVPGSHGRAEPSEQMTPLLLAVQDAPVPFMGSDGRVHLVYELEMTNFSSAEILVEKVEVLGDGVSLQTLDTTAVAERLQPAGMRESVGTLARSTRALLFLNVVLAPGAKIPAELSHRVALKVSAAPAGQQEFDQTGGKTTVDRRRWRQSALHCAECVTSPRTPAAMQFAIHERPFRSMAACG